MKEVNLDSLNLDSKQTTKFKKRKLFSWALFKESLKSNWISQLIVSLGNALVIIVVVLIMSTLTIGATSDSLANMMTNANMEHTLKQGVIGYYSSFSMSADTYEQLSSGQEVLTSSFYSLYDQVSDSSIPNLLSVVNLTYNTSYSLNSDDHTKAKENTLNYIENNISTFITNITDEEKEMLINVLGIYLDNYALYKNSGLYTNMQLLNLSISTYFVNYFNENNYSIKNEEELKNLIYTNLNEVESKINIATSDEKEEICKESAYEFSFELINNLVDEDMSIYIQDITNDMKSYYKADINSYMNNTNQYRDKSIASSIINMINSFMSEIVYYEYLPDFEVNIATNDLGYPIYYKDVEGEYDTNGNPYKEEVIITEYNPELFVTLANTLGSPANLVQKMHKDIITGEPYTQEEISQAKKESSDELTLMLDDTITFMDSYITRDEDNKNEFYDGSSILDNSIIEYAVSIILKKGEQEVLDSYNKENNTNFTSLNQITADNYLMSGEDIKKNIQIYSYSGIYSYKKLYDEYIDDGYSINDATLAGMNKASTTLMSQLPDKVNILFDEMSNMNTYGLIIGIVLYGMAALLMPLVYTIILSNSLVAEKIETGSLAFVLSTPTRRITFVVTQAVYLLVSMFVMGLIMYLGGLASRGIGILMGSDDLVSFLSIGDLTLYSLGAFMVMITISGICFLGSCLFNKTKQAIGFGGGINIFFYICCILGLFGSPVLPSTIRIDAMNAFNYMSILSLNDGIAVMDSDLGTYFVKLVSLLLITVGTYIAGSYVFIKKDLPL